MNQYVSDINTLIEEHFDIYFKKDTPMRQICTYIIEGGKRIRPSIIQDICKTLSGETVGRAALSIEYIHTASLVIDDLPCMDNALERRNKQCPHIKFDEASTQIASVVLLALGMDSLVKIKRGLETFVVENLSDVLGIHGAAGGQILELSKQGDLKEIIYKKTGKFFEFCFLFGWIYGGGSPEKLEDIKSLSYNFSMIFQIIDDFEDVEQDKSHNNYVLFYGREKALQDVQNHLKLFKQQLSDTNLNSSFFSDVLDCFDKKICLYI